jgi:serine/threonine-protein kinase RsbW
MNTINANHYTHIPFDQTRQPDFQIKVPSLLQSLKEIETLTDRVADQYRICEDDRDNIAIAITEVANNAIIHGNKLNYKKTVIISFYFDPPMMSVYIKDEGNGFNPNQLGNPLDPENLLKETGRGIFILRSLMDDVQFHLCPIGTEVKIVKKINRED